MKEILIIALLSTALAQSGAAQEFSNETARSAEELIKTARRAAAIAGGQTYGDAEPVGPGAVRPASLAVPIKYTCDGARRRYALDGDAALGVLLGHNGPISEIPWLPRVQLPLAEAGYALALEEGPEETSVFLTRPGGWRKALGRLISPYPCDLAAGTVLTRFERVEIDAGLEVVLTRRPRPFTMCWGRPEIFESHRHTIRVSQELSLTFPDGQSAALSAPGEMAFYSFSDCQAYFQEILR